MPHRARTPLRGRRTPVRGRRTPQRRPRKGGRRVTRTLDRFRRRR